MQKMNKEELINYFISALGGNQYLGKILSIEQIRTRLNNIIADIVYDDVTTSEGEYCSCATRADGTVVIFLSDKIPERNSISFDYS